jgi:hypothetical protein
MESAEHHESPKAVLARLATGAVERLGQLPQPVVRVSGPLTSGGFGYEENLRRFTIAQQKLRERGFTVFDYFEDNDDEDIIKTLDVEWGEVMEHYHMPILETGLIKTVYMMPRSEESNGAMTEKQYFEKNGLQIEQVPEEWFD